MIDVFHLIVNQRHRRYCNLTKEQAFAHGFTRWDRIDRRWDTTKSRSCPKSVIDAKHFRGKELRLDGLRGSSPKAGERVASGNPKPPGCLRFGLQRIGADSNLALARLRAFECPKPFLEGRQDNDNDDDILAPSRTQTPHPAVLAKPKQARNFKDLKGLKCRYTLGTRALNPNVIECLRMRDI